MKTAQAVIDGYNAWDIDAILAYRSPNCQHQVLPSSMGRVSQNNDEYRIYLSTIMPLRYLYPSQWYRAKLLRLWQVVIHKAVHDAEMHTCVIRASSTADTEIGPYANEYMLSLEFTEDGKQVKAFDEFVDSDYSERFFASLRDEQQFEEQNR